MSHLLDVSRLSDRACEEGLETMFKAQTGGGGDGIWSEHDSPWLREVIELFSERGLLQLEGVRREFFEFLEGARHSPAPRPLTPPGGMGRWSTDELRLMRLYLESLSPADFRLEDWGRLIEYLAQRYFPAEFTMAASEWMAAKSTVMGKVQAAVENADSLPEESIREIRRAAPETVAGAEALGLSDVERSVLRFARQSCADAVVNISDSLRSRMRRLILEHQKGEMLGDRAVTAEDLKSKLLDTFGTMNRDWRRIAVTETVENHNQGFIASLSPGDKVKRLEKYRDACNFCRRLHNQEFRVVDPAKAMKDPWAEVWVGKTNVGRAAAPMKRVEGNLVQRPEGERWWPAAGAQHPHCRGQWIKVKAAPRTDEAFAQWLDNLLEKPPEAEEDDSED